MLNINEPVFYLIKISERQRNIILDSLLFDIAYHGISKYEYHYMLREEIKNLLCYQLVSKITI